MTTLLPAIEFETRSAPTFSVIWLHGLGADGSDFEPVVPRLGLAPDPGVRFIFPHAPSIPVTCNGGYVMPAWYDIISLDSNIREIDETGLLRSREAIRRLIARENARGILSGRIFLAGFSQGGAVAYLAGLSHPEKLAGIIALSSYIPSPRLLAEEAAQANRETAVFAAHGRDDEVVSPTLGLLARDFLTQHGYTVEWHEYSMTHSVCDEEILAIGNWLRLRVATG